MSSTKHDLENFFPIGNTLEHGDDQTQYQPKNRGLYQIYPPAYDNTSSFSPDSSQETLDFESTAYIGKKLNDQAHATVLTNISDLYAQSLQSTFGINLYTKPTQSDANSETYSRFHNHLDEWRGSSLNLPNVFGNNVAHASQGAQLNPLSSSFNDDAQYELDEPQLTPDHDESHFDPELTTPANATGDHTVSKELWKLGQVPNPHLPPAVSGLQLDILINNTNCGAMIIQTLDHLKIEYKRIRTLSEGASKTLTDFHRANSNFFVDGTAQLKSHKSHPKPSDPEGKGKRRRTSAAIKALKEKKLALEKEQKGLRKKVEGYELLKEMVEDVVADLKLKLKLVKRFDAIGLRMWVEDAMVRGMGKVEVEMEILGAGSAAGTYNNAGELATGAENDFGLLTLPGEQTRFLQERLRTIRTCFEQGMYAGGTSRVPKGDRQLLEHRARAEMIEDYKKIVEVGEMLDYVTKHV